jgi:hypothetical protein
MIFLFLCLLTFQCPAYAKSMRNVYLSEGDLEPVYVEPGYSTLIKFDTHPEPGLIGDQDGFKVEYMKNLVAIKPLVSKGKTNLFIFTKDGQFNFQLIASKGRHDNIVYVQLSDRARAQSAAAKPALLVDDLLTRKMGKLALSGDMKLTLEAISTPVSRSTLVLKFSLEQKAAENHEAIKIDPKSFSVRQDAKSIKIENTFIETKKLSANSFITSGLILIRMLDIKKTAPLTLSFMSLASTTQSKKELQVTFSPDFGRR